MLKKEYQIKRRGRPTTEDRPEIIHLSVKEGTNILIHKLMLDKGFKYKNEVIEWALEVCGGYSCVDFNLKIDHLKQLKRAKEKANQIEFNQMDNEIYKLEEEKIRVEANKQEENEKRELQKEEMVKILETQIKQSKNPNEIRNNMKRFSKNRGFPYKFVEDNIEEKLKTTRFIKKDII